MLLKLEKYLVLSLAVFLPSQLAWHWWPQWSLVSGIRIDYLSPTLYLTDLLVLLILLLTFYQRQLKISKWHVLLIFLSVINIAGANIPQLAFLGWARVFEYVFLGSYLYQRLDVVKKQLVSGLIIALVWSSVLALWQFISQHSINGIWYFLGERSFSVSTPGIAKVSLGSWGYLLRSYATLPHPNALAGFLIIGLGLIHYYDNKVFRKIYFVVGIVIAAFLTTVSRLGIFVGTGIFILSTRLKKYLWPVLLLPFIIPGNPSSFTERVILNSRAFNVFLSAPIFGVGLENFIPKLTSIFQPVHNIFLLILTETGIIGFGLAFIWLLKNIQGLVKNQQWQLLVLLVVVLAIGMGDHYWLTLHQTSLLLAILLSTIAIQSKTS